MKWQNVLSALLIGGGVLGAAETDLRALWEENDVRRREQLQDVMQNVINRTPKAEFEAFDLDPEAKTDNPLLQYYDLTLDRLLADIPATKVASGNVVIWYLYNMGFVIKTPTVCFGVDLHHRRAEKLEPLIDFLVTTHNHDDHWSQPLLAALGRSGKPILSNFHPNSYYTKAAEATREIKGITIHCGEANHNDRLRKFTMPMEIVCPTGDKNFVFFTSGDCADHKFLHRKSPAIDLYCIHPRCIMEPVEAAKQLQPKLTFIVHLQEMGHEINRYRWPISVGREEVENLRKIQYQAYVPVWGEKFLWDGEKIRVCQKSLEKGK